jgi:hypothetical protein
LVRIRLHRRVEAIGEPRALDDFFPRVAPEILDDELLELEVDDSVHALP